MTDGKHLQLEVDGQLVQGRIEGCDDRGLPMVVYLHGFGSTAFGSKGDFFSERFVAGGMPFCRFDLRGHGASAGDLTTATVERNLLDLGAVITDLRRRGWSRFVLVGSSYGALTALVYAARNPHLVVACAFIAAAVGIAESIRRREGDGRLHAWRVAGEAPIGDGEQTLAWGFFEDATRWDAGELATKLRVPCLLFHGLDDEEVDWRAVHGLAAASDYVQLHGFVAGGHRLVEHLPTIWEESRRFLSPHLKSG